MITSASITALRMERQCLNRRVGLEEYIQLYRDLQPGQSVYWHGFGEPPCLSFRADFDDSEFNRRRQAQRALVKGRFQGGNLGWVMGEDLELFAALARKPLLRMSQLQASVYELICREGPMTIAQIKEITGLLVKEITPILHRLQEAFLIYEDQYDGEWDRAWYRFGEMFPDVNLGRYTRIEALKIVLGRFALRMVWFDPDMAKNYYKLPLKDIKSALGELVAEGVLVIHEGGYLRKEDLSLLEKETAPEKSLYVLHRNDILVKVCEPALKERFPTNGRDLLQYILVDGEIAGAVIGKFRYGPYDLDKIVMDLPQEQAQGRKAEIVEAVIACNCPEEAPKELPLYCTLHE